MSKKSSRRQAVEEALRLIDIHFEQRPCSEAHPVYYADSVIALAKILRKALKPYDRKQK